MVPELVDIIVKVLKEAPGRTLPLGRLHGEMRKENKRMMAAMGIKRSRLDRNGKPCVRDCLELQLPGPQHMSGVLRELSHRKLLVTETRAVGADGGGHGIHEGGGRRRGTESVLQVKLLDGV